MRSVTEQYQLNVSVLLCCAVLLGVTSAACWTVWPGCFTTAGTRHKQYYQADGNTSINHINWALAFTFSCPYRVIHMRCGSSQ